MNKTGFDTNTFDTEFYDNQPVEETRIILEVIRDSLFVDDLETEYNELFYPSLRYAFSEQSNLDWAFKTSFINATPMLENYNKKLHIKTITLIVSKII